MKTIAYMLLINILMVTIAHSEASGATKSVSWYQTHKAERLRKVEECNDNPGELAATANCVNALRANGAKSWGDDKATKQTSRFGAPTFGSQNVILR
jgi:hypothetical protein